MSHKSVLIII